MPEKERHDSVLSAFRIPDKGVFAQFLHCVPTATEEHYYVPMFYEATFLWESERCRKMML